MPCSLKKKKKNLFPLLQSTLIQVGSCLFRITKTVVVTHLFLKHLLIYYQLNCANCSHLILLLTLFNEEKQTQSNLPQITSL